MKKRIGAKMGSLETWGAIAASFLLLQCILANLAFVALSVALYLVTRWTRQRTHGGLLKVGEFFQRGRSLAEQVQSHVAAPFVRIHARVAGLRTAWERLRG